MAETAITETEFLQSHFREGNSMNEEGIINFRITPIREEGFDGDYIIKSCTVTTSTQSSTLTDSQVEVLLRQAETIILFKTQDDQAEDLFNDGKIVLKIIPSRKSFQRVPQGQDFFYFPVEDYILKSDNLRTTIDNDVINTFTQEVADSYNNVSILFEPFITDIDFSFSEFNATISNAIDSRTSTRIVESDRNTGTITPSNFNAIISGSANPAQIQDSLYDLTGWSNSRYRGTKTSRRTYNNLSPTLNGTSFKGEIYSTGSLNDAICNIEFDGRVIDTFLFSGETDLPSTGSEDDLIVKFVDDSSKIEAAANAKVWIQETNSIANTDGFGKVKSIVKCSSI